MVNSIFSNNFFNALKFIKKYRTLGFIFSFNKFYSLFCNSFNNFKTCVITNALYEDMISFKSIIFYNCFLKVLYTIYYIINL